MGTGKTYSTKYLLDSNNSSGVAGQVLSTTSTGIDWVDANTVPGTGLWLANGNDIYNSNSGNVGIGTTGPFSPLQVGNNTFNGTQGMVNNSRVGISNHGSLTGLMLASTYNDATFPEYGVVFVQGPSTSSYNVWSISPDGPAKGGGLSFIYQANSTNIHNKTPKVYFDGTNSSVGIGTITPSGNLSMNSQIHFGVSPPSTYTTNTDSTRYQSFFNSGYANTTDGLGPYPRYFDMVATGSPDGTNGGSNLRFFTTGIVAATGAQERMRIFSNGNVNIGVAETGSSAVTGPFVVTHSSSRFLTSSFEEGTVSLSAKNNNNNLESLRIAGDSIKFFNGTNAVGSQKMVILSSGLVGINVTSPQTRLQTNLGITGSYLGYLNGTASTFDMSANVAVVHNSPAIGNGTGAGLVLANNDKSNGAPSPIIAFSAKSASNAYNHTYAAIYGIRTASGADTNWTKGDIVLATGAGTGPNEIMRVTSAGNVGIGEVGPSSKLVVRKDNAGGRGGEISIVNYATNTVGNEAALNFGLESSTYHADLGNAQIKARVMAADAASDMIFSTWNGSSFGERMRIDAGGNVGINETSPFGKLHIKTSDTGVTSASAQGNLLVLEDSENGLSILSSTAGAGYINFGDSDDNDIGMIVYGHSSNSMDFWTNAGKRMTIDSSGNVTLNSATALDFQVADFAQIKFRESGAITIDSDNNQSSRNFAIKDGSGSNLLTVLDTGNVGIGTTNPTESMLVISAGTTGTTGGGQAGITMINKFDNPDNSWSILPVITGVANTGLSIRDNTDSADRLVIDGSGKVGIGATTPGQKLHVDGNIRVGDSADVIFSNKLYGLSTGDLTISTSGDTLLTQTGNVGINTTNPLAKLTVNQDSFSDTEGIFVQSGDNAANGGVAIFKSATKVGTISSLGSASSLTFMTDGGNERMRITSGGNVEQGIVGTTASAYYYFNASTTGDTGIIFRDNASTNSGFLTYNHDQDAMKFATAGSERMRINSAGEALFYGNVGINMTTSPSEKLEVNGNVKVQGDIIVNSDIELGPSSRIQLDDTPTASTASGSGTIVNWSVSESTTAGSLYVVKTNGGWQTTDADIEDRSIGMLAIALSSNANLGMLLQGFFYKASHGFTIGLPLYISNTAGAFTTTRPTGTNDYVRIIGYATSTNYIYFDPDKTWVKLQ